YVFRPCASSFVSSPSSEVGGNGDTKRQMANATRTSRGAAWSRRTPLRRNEASGPARDSSVERGGATSASNRQNASASGNDSSPISARHFRVETVAVADRSRESACAVPCDV